MLAQWGQLGSSIPAISETPFNIPDWGGVGTVAENTLNFLFGVETIPNWQFLLVMVLVFLILGIAFQDIFQSFTSFSAGRAMLIAWLLAVLASVLGVVRGIAVWLGLTAGLGAVGIGIVLVNSVIVFVAVNLFIGKNALIKMKEAKTLEEIEEAASKTKLAYASARRTVKAINEGDAAGAGRRAP